MATVSLTDQQVIDLVKQLPTSAKQRVLKDLTSERDQWWNNTAKEGEARMRAMAQERGVEWDKLSESDRERFVDKLLHES
jgi:hypothetical protein